MTFPLINQIVAELIKRFGDPNFYTIEDLITLGFFTNPHAARMALKDGKIAFLKISPRRRLIPREALIDYLRNNLSGNR